MTTTPPCSSAPPNDESHAEWLAHSLRRGSRVVLVVHIISQAASLVILAVLWRQLGTEPYGLVGMVTPLVALARILIASGLDAVTIQQARLSDQQVSTLWWINQALGVLCAAVIALSAPLVAAFYRVPELNELTVALAGISVVFVLGVQHQALLQRRMRLGALAIARLVATLVGGAAGIALAAAGCGVWALVGQQYAEGLALAALVWLLEPWRPTWVWRGTGGRTLVRFGGHYMTSSLMLYVATNLDKVLVGYWLGEQALALYGQAFGLAMKLVNTLMTPLTGVMFPTLSRAADRPRQFAELLLGFFRFLALAMFPAGVGLALVAPEAVRLLGGQVWAGAGPLLRILAFTIPGLCFYIAAGSVLAAAGRTRQLSAASILSTAALCVLFSLGLGLGRWFDSALSLPQDQCTASLLGISLGYVAGLMAFVLPALLTFTLAVVGVSCREWLDRMVPALRATLGMALLVGTCHVLFGYVVPIGDAGLLAIELTLGVSSYLVFSRRALAWFVRQALGTMP